MTTKATTDSKHVCLIIPTYNSWLSTTSMIRDILNNQSFKNMTIIVVDAGSDDYLKLKQEFKQEIRSGKMILIHLNKDLGGSGSFYVGLRYCLSRLTCDIIILSDNDAKPLSTTLIQSLIEKAKRKDNVVVRPRNFNYDISNWFPFHFLTIPRKCLEEVDLDSMKEYFIHKDDYAFITELRLHSCEVETINEWYSHPMKFPRIYYFIRNIVFQYLYKPKYHIKLKDVILSFLVSLLQASYVISNDALKAVFIGFFHGIKGRLSRGPDNLAKLSLAKFSRRIDASYVDIFVFASHEEPKCRNLKSSNYVRYTELPTNNIIRMFKSLTKYRNKVIATDVGFVVFSILLLIAKKVVFVIYDPISHCCELKEYSMRIFNKLFVAALSIITVPLVAGILLLSKVYKKLLDI